MASRGRSRRADHRRRRGSRTTPRSSPGRWNSPNCSHGSTTATPRTSTGTWNQAHNDYREISALLRADIKPPEGLAGLYRALATLPHLDVVDHMVEDAAGRRAVALRYSGNDSGDGRIEREWLIDPETYEVLGERMINDGETVTDKAFAAVVVDGPGERG